MGGIADSSTEGDTVRLAPGFGQLESADDVAAALAEIARAKADLVTGRRRGRKTATEP